MAKVELFLKLYLLLPAYTAGHALLTVTLTDIGSVWDTDLLEDVEVDWGDTNTTTTTVPSSGYNHTYTASGTYTITITFTDVTGRTETQTIESTVNGSSGFNYDLNFNFDS